ncbi:hypothetical protein [Streptomyces sp. NPDC001020]
MVQLQLLLLQLLLLLHQQLLLLLLQHQLTSVADRVGGHLPRTRHSG